MDCFHRGLVTTAASGNMSPVTIPLEVFWA
ncbi:hypothetical protein Tco_0661572, partial [Tanacetum coccineum]